MRITVLTICLVVLPLGLTGCASTEVPVQPVAIIGSDFCDIAGDKLTWDVKDTPPTINGINRFNAKWDARCGKKSEPTS